MKFLFSVFLIQCFVACLLTNASNGQKSNNQANKALRIVKKNTVLLDYTNQLLLVFNKTPESDSAILVALEKKGKDWLVVSAPMSAGIGRKGFAAPDTKREGDEKSPTGFFRLGQLFCYEKNVNTRMPYLQTTSEDKWIDDPDSPDYNRHVRGPSEAKSFEKLLLNGNDYRYCLVIEYNTHPVVKGMGSAIFLHLSEGEKLNASSGCIVLTQKDMEWLLTWMKPELKPSILMGHEKVLADGLKN